MAAINFNFIEAGYSPPANLNFDFGASSVIVIDVLAGSNNNFTSVWADPTANINTAKLYVASNGTGAAFSIVSIQFAVELGHMAVVPVFEFLRSGLFGQLPEIVLVTRRRSRFEIAVVKSGTPNRHLARLGIGLSPSYLRA